MAGSWLLGSSCSVWMQPQNPLLAGFLRSSTDGCRAACEVLVVEVWT